MGCVSAQVLWMRVALCNVSIVFQTALSLSSFSLIFYSSVHECKDILFPPQKHVDSAPNISSSRPPQIRTLSTILLACFASSSSSSRPYPLLHIISIFRHCARSHMFPCIRNGPPPPHELFAVSVKLIIRAGLLHIAVMRCVTDGGGPSLLSSWGGQESWPSASSPSN